MVRSFALFWLFLVPAAAALDLETIMADPDWIGPPVENAHWALDGSAVHFELKESGSPLRARYRLDLDSGEQTRLELGEQQQADAPRPVFDRNRERALFLRDGDLYLRDLRSGALRQLTRGLENLAEPGFTADGGVHYRQGQDWFRIELSQGTVERPFLLQPGNSPDADPKPDALRETQLRLFETLRRDREHAAERRAVEAQRRSEHGGPGLFYLGEERRLLASNLSPSGQHLLIVTGPREGRSGRVGQMPLYVTESGYEETEEVRSRVGRDVPSGHELRLLDRANGRELTLSLSSLPGITEDPLQEMRVAAAERTATPATETRTSRRDQRAGRRDGSAAESVPRPVRVSGSQWNADGNRLVIQLRAIDNKDRWLAEVDLSSGELKPLHRLTDPAWINWRYNEFGWMEDGESLWFLSEETGFSHLYTLSPRDRAPQARSSGAFEVSAPQQLPDGRGFVVMSNPEAPYRYDAYRLSLADNRLEPITRHGGVESFQLDPVRERLLLTVSAPYLPAQVAVQALAGGSLQVLTDTRSGSFRGMEWIAPELVQVPSRHGAGVIHGKLYRDPRRVGPQPIVLFAHGAGYLQNVHLRYPLYFREQMFHNLLVQDGFIVLDLDFRASAGYGRDWRTAIYQRMGHPELEDYLDGIEWLAAEHGGDPERVGIYGGSYGGFISLMALFREPDRFHAGAALRPVTDWMHYSHEYTANILNTPELDPEAYLRSSPIEFVEGFRGHLLMAHGMMDDNVLYQDVVRLAQRLIELRKENWELASYPLERHSYVHAESWLDQYRRIRKLFRQVLL